MIVEAEKRGEIRAGRHADRGDVRQHRHRARDGGGDQGLPADPGDARQPDARAPPDDDGLRRRAGAGDQGRAAWKARATWPSGCATKDAARSSTSSPIPTIRSRTTAAPARRSGATPTATITHFVSAMGTTGTIMGMSRFLKEKNPAITDRRRAAGRGRVIPGIRKWPPAYLPKIFDRGARRSHRARLAGRRRGDGAPPRARGRHLRRHLVGRRMRDRAARLAQARARDDRVRRLRPRRSLPVDRRLPNDADPRLRHRDRARRRRHPPAQRHRCRSLPDADVHRLVRSSGAPPPAATSRRCTCSRSSRSPARCAATTTFACGRSAKPTEPEPELIRRFFDGIEKLYAAARVVERRRLRPAGAAPSRADPRRGRAALLGLGRRRPRLQVTTTTCRATTRATRPDGRARAASSRAPSPGSTRWRGCAVSRARSAWTAPRSPTAVAAGRARRSAQLLRVRRDEHVPPLPALPADARRARGRRICAEISLARERVAAIDAPHWREFLAAWGA